MSKRPQEVDKAMSVLDTFVDLPSYWREIKNYITELEEFKKNALDAQERNTDDGK